MRNERQKRLAPKGIPRWVRCYDNGDETIDRYTVVFAKVSEHGEYPYLSMSASPFHPQGFGQHGFSEGGPCDSLEGWPPAIGRKNHLGVRIRFQDLPQDCQRLVWHDYAECWRLRIPAKYES